MGIFIVVLETKRNDALSDYKFYLNANTKDYITLVQEERYFLVKSNLDSVRSKILNRKMWFTALLGFAFGLALAMLAVVLSALALCFISPDKFSASYAKIYVKFLVIGVPALLGGLVGLLRRKNPILIFILTVAIIGFVFAMLFVVVCLSSRLFSSDFFSADTSTDSSLFIKDFLRQPNEADRYHKNS